MALAIPYFISVRAQFDAMIEQTKERILKEKKQTLVERVERINLEEERVDYD